MFPPSENTDMQCVFDNIVNTVEFMDEETRKAARAMSGFEKLKLVSDMFTRARNMLVAHLEKAHPEWTEDQVSHEASRIIFNYKR